MISHGHKFVFVHIYKTAGTSIRSALSDAADRLTLKQRVVNKLCRFLHREEIFKLPPQLWKHAGALEYRSFLKEDWSQYFKFAVVRNPFDWQVSIYEYIRQTPSHHLHRFCNTVSFLAYLQSQVSEAMRPQTYFLYDENGLCYVDMIIRFESLIEDFPKVLSQIGLGNKCLHHLNSSSKKQLSFYFCDEAVSIIKLRFKNDFSTFGYSLDVPSYL
jgi:hypothetical protein